MERETDFKLLVNEVEADDLTNSLSEDLSEDLTNVEVDVTKEVTDSDAHAVEPCEETLISSDSNEYDSYDEYLNSRAEQHEFRKKEIDARFDACINTIEECIEQAVEQREEYEEFIKENSKIFNRDLIVNGLLSVVFICLFFLNVDILLSFLGLLYFFISLFAMFVKNLFLSDPTESTGSKIFSLNMFFVFIGVIFSLPMLNDTATGPVVATYSESSLYLMEEFGFDYLCIVDTESNFVESKLPIKKNISRFFKEVVSVTGVDDESYIELTYFPSSGLVESIAVLDTELDKTE